MDEGGGVFRFSEERKGTQRENMTLVCTRSFYLDAYAEVDEEYRVAIFLCHCSLC